MGHWIILDQVAGGGLEGGDIWIDTKDKKLALQRAGWREVRSR